MVPMKCWLPSVPSGLQCQFRFDVPLYAAVARTMEQRGTILTNQSFRAQLVRKCFKMGLNLTGTAKKMGPLWVQTCSNLLGRRMGLIVTHRDSTSLSLRFQHANLLAVCPQHCKSELQILFASSYLAELNLYECADMV